MTLAGLSSKLCHAFMTRIFLSLLLVTAVVPFYLVGNLMLVALIRRRAQGWVRSLKLFGLRQVRPLTANRISATTLGHIVAVTMLIVGLRRPLEIVELALLLLGYVFVVSALSLSLLAQMPAFRRVWSSVPTRLFLLGAPFVLAYLTRGYSQMWLDETLTLSAENAPMAHFAGTIMMAGLAAAGVLFGFALLFEAALIIMPSLPTSKRKKARSQSATVKPTFRSMALALFSAKLDVHSLEHREWRPAMRAFGLFLICALSFLGCYSAFFAAISPFRSDFGAVVLKAIAFDFDAASAEHCGLNKDERRAAAGSTPRLKALMLSTSQEKAVLLTRSAHLFDPVMMSILGKEKDRSLTIGRPVACFEAASANAASP